MKLFYLVNNERFVFYLIVTDYKLVVAGWSDRIRICNWNSNNLTVSWSGIVPLCKRKYCETTWVVPNQLV